jgi:hypothetical protein
MSEPSVPVTVKPDGLLGLPTYASPQEDDERLR